MTPEHVDPTAKPRFLRAVRLLAQCDQSFERLPGRQVRELGLTPVQFDIVAPVRPGD